jgi:FMN phosphatase YigB (HAD superfamily)
MKVIFDMDSTLCNIDHLLPLWETDRDQFYARLGEAKVVKPIRTLFNRVSRKGDESIIYTARPEKTRITTGWWCQDNGIYYDEMYMRADNDDRDDVEVKVDMLTEAGLTPDKVLFIVEDKTKVVNKLRELGYTVLQCANGDY